MNGGVTLSVNSTRFIAETPGFSPQLGHLVSMMNYARFGTLDLVCELSVDELDYIHDEQSNSIGALLLHMAALETAQQVWSFKNRELNEKELIQWGVALNLGDRGRREISGFTSTDYIQCLNQVRQRTLDEFKRRDDKWLYTEVPSRATNQYCRWFHVVEDEISHRGQIKWLLERLKVRHPNTRHNKN